MMLAWTLVFAIMAATAGADVLQSLEMKRHKEAGIAETAIGIFRRPLLMIAVLCMAVSFFSFLALLRIADLSFAVPATAGSFVLETVLAKYVLRERVDARRWTGALLVACGVALLAV
jgi:drug/metabolite transporter (DMT)-like permease